MKKTAFSTKAISICLALCLVLSVFSGISVISASAEGDAYEIATSYAGGSGTETDPYHIETADQLYKMVREGGVGADGTSKGYFVLDNDIVLNDTTDWAPDKANTKGYKNWSAGVTDTSTKFIGDFDGQYHTISGLYANNSDCNGFIHRTNADVTIKNVCFENAYVHGSTYVGTVIGYAEGGCDITFSQVLVNNSKLSSGWGTSAGLIGEATMKTGKRVTFMDCAAINVDAPAIFIHASNAKPITRFYGCWAAGCTATDYAKYTADRTVVNCNIIADSASVQGEAAVTALPNADWDLWEAGAEGEYPYIKSKADTWDGMTFSSDVHYESNTVLKDIPLTFEATVKLPADMASADKGGVIFGNYSGAANRVSFEIGANGNPCLYIINDRTAYDVVFNEINVYNGEWTHIAVVIDSAADTVSCYINGALAQTVSVAVPEIVKVYSTVALGGDSKEENTEYFKGNIKDFALYSDARTADEVASDYASDTVDTSELLAAYDFSAVTSYILKDQSGNGFDFAYTNYTQDWITEKEEVTDYAYTFAFVGDTQMVNYHYPETFHYIYDYLVDIVDEKKLKFVLGLGDITDRNTEAEWNLAVENIQKLDGVVPYSLIRGNHDAKTDFVNYFSYDAYTNQLGGKYENSILNCWQTFSVGTINYLIMCLDYGADDAVLNWAGSVIESHPDHNVIITTHAYLDSDGTPLDDADTHAPTNLQGGKNNGDDMWNKLFKKYENITMVVSGHIESDDIVVTKTEGDNGNIVTQMLIDPQYLDYRKGSTGLVALFHFSADGRKVEVEYYSTVKEQYFKANNQFTMSVASVGGNAGYQIADSYAGGDGTEANPYQIATAEQLAKMVNDAGRIGGSTGTTSAYYILTADIDLNPTDNWDPENADDSYKNWGMVDQVYTSANGISFIGHLDGNGKTISHLYTNTGSDYNNHAALIQHFDLDASVKNLTLTDFYSEGTFTAGIAALDRDLAEGDAAAVNFQNITVKSGILVNNHTSNGGSGGIIARAANTMVIESCNAYDLHFSRKVTAVKAGAIVGNAGSGSGASVTNCTAKGCFGVDQLKGGALGNGSNGTFEDFYLDVNYASGSGTANDPYHIANPNQLLKMVRTGGVGADGTGKGYFVLDKDIVLNDTTDWAPDNSNTKGYRNWSEGTTLELPKFIGDFDGQYHTISGLYANNNHISDCNGFIHRSNGDVTIKNVTFENSYVRGSKYAGTIIGYAETGYNTTMTQVMVIDSAMSSGWGYSGGFIGEATRGTNKSATFIDCAAIDVTADGIFVDAYNTKSTVKLYGCWAAGCLATDGTASNYVTVTTNLTATNSYILADSASVQGETALEALPGIDFEYAWAVGEGTEYPSTKAYDIWDGTATTLDTVYMDGEGTVENPYKVTTGAQLYAAVNTKNTDVYFSIENDIYLNEFREVNSGYHTTHNWFFANYDPFVGTIDGNGHSIYGLYLKANGWSPVGLFNVVGMGAEIKDITLDGATVTGNQYFTAGLIGRVVYVADTEASYTSAAVVEGCAVINSTISATQASTSKRIGAVIGNVSGDGVKLNVSNCYAAGNTLSNSYNTGDNQDSFYGGIIGHVTNAAHIVYIDDCYSDGYPVIAAGSEDNMHKGISVNTIGDVYSVNMTDAGYDGVYTDKYAVETYADMVGLFETDSAWYQAEGKAPLLINRTDSFIYPDFDADGIDEAPDATSVVIMRKNLLGIKGYNLNNAVGNVTGDSSADGTVQDVVDIRDLVRLKRYLVGNAELKKN